MQHGMTESGSRRPTFSCITFPDEDELRTRAEEDDEAAVSPFSNVVARRMQLREGRGKIELVVKGVDGGRCGVRRETKASSRCGRHPADTAHSNLRREDAAPQPLPTTAGVGADTPLHTSAVTASPYSVLSSDLRPLPVKTKKRPSSDNLQAILRQTGGVPTHALLGSTVSSYPALIPLPTYKSRLVEEITRRHASPSRWEITSIPLTPLPNSGNTPLAETGRRGDPARRNTLSHTTFFVRIESHPRQTANPEFRTVTRALAPREEEDKNGQHVRLVLEAENGKTSVCRCERSVGSGAADGTVGILRVCGGCHGEWAGRRRGWCLAQWR
ncbi:hypothetical protein R3P38DRAFT_3459207 [Favolaschia claudopus]|uniref:Uncharacterized protein n=1 Tax=Favolaschia claudopus TaxID=2862362 RepID=A0AAV9ZH97_9AGAR